MRMQASPRASRTSARERPARRSASAASARREISGRLADQIAEYTWSRLPRPVREHAEWSFLNFVGCMVGGSRHDAVERAGQALELSRLPGRSLVIGAKTRTSPSLAATLNCIAASVNAFDDTHADSMVHASSVVGPAIMAVSSRASSPLSGRRLLTAFACGVELMCRLSKAISRPPARIDLGWSQSGLTGAVACAAACSTLMGASRDELLRSMGIAASLSSGSRAAHGTMTMHLVPARAATLGVEAALLSGEGFTGPPAALEDRHGFFALFCSNPQLSCLIDGWGRRFEILANNFKAYPCGIVVHPVIDACLRLHEEVGRSLGDIEEIRVGVSPIAAKLADRADPASEFEAQVSIQHWAAVALLRGSAGIAEGSEEALRNVHVRGLRSRCVVRSERDLPSHAARVRVRTADGATRTCAISHCKGSTENPLTREYLIKKFLDQASPVLGKRKARRALELCRTLSRIRDANRLWRQLS